MNMPFSSIFLRKLIEGDDVVVNEDQQGDFPGLADFTEIYPEKGAFLQRCVAYLRALNSSSSREEALDLQKQHLGAELRDLCLTMEFPAIFKGFGQNAFKLRDNHAWDDENGGDVPPQEDEEVNTDNLGLYIRRTIDFAMNKGIRKQLRAFRSGFNLVLSLRSLAIFTPQELNKLISGERSSKGWTYEELAEGFEPVNGYTRESPGFQMLLRVLTEITTEERRDFVKFVTGSPNLPPGGFKSLNPRIKVALKESSAHGPYPSVNTCMHYLKLPEYRTPEQLREKLFEATIHVRFLLN